MRKLGAKSLRLARVAGALLFLFAAAVFTLLSSRDVGFHFGNCRFVSITNATLQLGMNENRFTIGRADMGRGFYSQEAWNPDWTWAWRPFHAHDRFSRTASWHMLVFPLWPLMPLGAAVAAYAHGVLVGMRRARTSECPQCGYDLRKTPVVNATRTCPECGKAVTLQPPAAATA